MGYYKNGKHSFSGGAVWLVPFETQKITFWWCWIYAEGKFVFISVLHICGNFQLEQFTRTLQDKVEVCRPGLFLQFIKDCGCFQWGHCYNQDYALIQLSKAGQGVGYHFGRYHNECQVSSDCLEFLLQMVQLVCHLVEEAISLPGVFNGN